MIFQVFTFASSHKSKHANLNLVGTATVMFIQLLGGALFVSVAQNIFDNALVANLLAALPNLDPSLIVKNGATDLVDLVGANQIGEVLVAYNAAITQTFRIPLILACLSIFGAIAMEWRSVKEKKVEAVLA
jgi:Na+/H+ antiporter NhaC